MDLLNRGGVKRHLRRSIGPLHEVSTPAAPAVVFPKPRAPLDALIERLWKFVKRDVLSGRHYANFTEFRRAINGCLDNIPTKHRPHLATLMTHNFKQVSSISNTFQQFNAASVLTA